MEKNNCLLGYCLGGMVSAIISVLDTRVYQSIFMTIGGHLPKILFQSRATRFVRKIIQDGFKNEYYHHDKKRLYSIYKEQLPSVKKMSLHEILNNEEIHPLFRIDPLSYLTKKGLTVVAANPLFSLPVFGAETQN